MAAIIKGLMSLKSNLEKSYENYKKSPKDRLAKESYLQTRLETLESQWMSILKARTELISEITDTMLENDYFTNDVFANIEEVYINYKSDIKEALYDCVPKSASSNCVQPICRNESNVRLPKINIPSFSGQYSEWPSFRDLYVSLIHNNASIDNVQKMHYLKGHLSGEAEQLLRHVPITGDNYQESWNILNGRYNNKKYLANGLLRRFMNQPNIITESCSAIKEMLDTTNDTLNGLKNLGLKVDSWDVIIIYIICMKLDSETRKQWEVKISVSDELPTLPQMREFLEARFRSLEFLNPKTNSKTSFSTQRPKVMHAIADGSSTVTDLCSFCKKGNHKLWQCRDFSELDYDARHSFVQTNAFCFNCLGRNHSANACRTSTKCRICKRNHHSLLHPKPASEARSVDAYKEEVPVEVKSVSSETQIASGKEVSESNVATHFSKAITPSQILLATAIVRTHTRSGDTQLLRTLLDQGSQASFVTEAVVQLLGLKKILSKSVISGLGGDIGTLASKYMVVITVQSRHDPSFKIEVQAHVLGSITSLLPSRKIETIEWPELAEISLADPEFKTPNKIDILLGADAYGQVLGEGLIKSPNGRLIAQQTALGWVISGPTHHGDVDQSSSQQSYHNLITSTPTHVDENELLKKFWQIESDVFDEKMLTHEEQLCEDFYKRTTRRDSSGRYIVQLPFKEEDPQCKYGNSKDIALKRFHHLEHRFKKDLEIKKRYTEVIREYLDLGHMERISSTDNNAECVYLPHHAVIRDSKTTSKVRVVFDASCKGTNGVSLNDTLMVGPTLQQDLRHIIMRWRTHPICLSADIIKMYRQVIVAQQDTDFQRLLWRDDPGSEIEEYRLVRVTFGTASAPYLAVKTLQQLAVDEAEESGSSTSEKIKTDFYVDDLLTGCQTVEDGIRIYEEMTKTLKKGGFELQKWVTNNKELANVVMDREGNQDGKVDLKMDEVVKILGLSWDKESDSFHYTAQLPILQDPVTKRKVISDISRLFDPLGWVAPCVIVAKIMIQKLWLAGIEWDEELPANLLEEWLTYRSKITDITNFSIPRWMQAKEDDACREIHGFCDASNAAYAGVVYLRTIDAAGTVHVNLVAAKTKVAPTMQISIPRLELMGAVLVAKLSTEIAKVFNIDKTNIHGWTDSTVVLAWLSSHPSRWKTFIANRTSEILTRFDSSQWSHVQSSQNPADIASRGCTPSELVQNDTWLQGPAWLNNPILEYRRPKSISTNLEERHIKVHVAVDATADPIWNKFSSLQRLIHVVAFCRRFLKIKDVKANRHNFQPYLESSELNDALDTCIMQCQAIELEQDKSKLKSLNPYKDDKGILRAQGRIQHSNLTEDAKHPIILPHKSHLTNLIIDDAHKQTLHGGPLLMLNYLRSRYWIISAKGLVRKHVHKCVICVRHAATTKNQLMGQLPPARVTHSRPFLKSGVDFAGPINMRVAKGRGNKSYKGYICLFICMVTKAIHLEAISDLTSQSFVAGFKRFVARRGHVSDIWSDNGTNFVGAAKELRLLVAAEESSIATEIREWLNIKGVTWHFIPPHASNFGGLWEAGVKSTKFHLKRVIGNSTLTFEEMTTVLSQIEACLNSRPLSMLPNNHNDPSPLTPGHFLVGEPLIVVPERNYELSNISTLKRWQQTQRMLQDFWRRWSDEYLVHCLQRYKWSKLNPEPRIGDVVLVKEDNLPPARWLLGKVVTKHPGLDQITRVVTLKCNGALLKRPTSKLCVLPVTD